MKILIVTSWYYPNMLGGAEHSAKLLAENLSLDSNIKVSVLAFDNIERTISEESISNVRVFRGFSENRKNKLMSKLDILFNRHIHYQLMHVIKCFQPDVVHTNNMEKIPFSIWRILKTINIPVIHTIRDYGLVSLRGVNEDIVMISFFYRTFLFCYIKYTKLLLRNISYITAPSEYTINALRQKGVFDKTLTALCIPNSIELDNMEFNRCLKLKANRKNDKIKFIFAGRLLKLKGLHHLIDAFNMLEGNRASLSICGAGELEDYILKQVKKNPKIEYYGQLTSEELSDKYKDSDVLVVPSIWDEPFGRVIIEGCACGLVVIGSDRGGIPHLIKDLGCGEVYENGSVASLAAKLSKFMDRSHLSKFYDNIQHNMYKYSIDFQISKFKELYTHVLKRRSCESVNSPEI